MLLKRIALFALFVFIVAAQVWPAAKPAPNKPAKPAQVEEIALYVVARTPTPIKVDGVLDEEVWSRVRAWSPFVDTATGRAVPYSTTAKLLYDDNYLYVAFKCEDGDIWSDFTERDHDLWNNEVVEIFIDPAHSRTKYFEFEVSPRNVVWDGRITNPKGTGEGLEIDSKWNCERFNSAVNVKGTLDNRKDKDEGWTAEMAIPHTCLVRIPPQPGDEWWFNMYRIERGEKLDLLAWNPTMKPGFHIPAKFGRLVFSMKGPIYAPVF